MNTREHRVVHPHGDLAEEIRHEAYLLWQKDGCPAGRELDHWLAAQELVRHRRHLPRAHLPDERDPAFRDTERLVTPN